MPIKNFVVRDEYFDNPFLTHIVITRGVVYTAVEDDGEGVHFADDTNSQKYLFYKTIRTVSTSAGTAVQIPDAPEANPSDDAIEFMAVIEDVQNPDEGIPVVPVPDPAIHHPSHYNRGGIECIDAIRASMSLEAFRGFLKGNQLKYLWRYESKGKSAEDIGKSNWYGAELEKSLKGEPTQ